MESLFSQPSSGLVLVGTFLSIPQYVWNFSLKYALTMLRLLGIIWPAIESTISFGYALSLSAIRCSHFIGHSIWIHSIRMYSWIDSSLSDIQLGSQDNFWSHRCLYFLVKSFCFKILPYERNVDTQVFNSTLAEMAQIRNRSRLVVAVRFLLEHLVVQRLRM